MKTYIVTMTIETDVEANTYLSEKNLKERIEGAVDSLRYVGVLDCNIVNIREAK